MSHAWKETAMAGVFGIALIATVFAQPGPAWLWASDVCPAEPFTCGVTPPGLLLIAGGMVVLNAIVQRVGGSESA